MTGLKCLLTKASHIKLIGEAMSEMSDTILQNNPTSKITVGGEKGLYGRLKKAGVDIDMESAAYIYSDVFANEINQFTNYETTDEIQQYAKKYPPASAEVKKALMDAGFSKETKSGNKILDWTQLMQKTEEEIREEIRDKNLGNEDEIFGALQNEWKQIISTALIKAKNDLSKSNADVTPSQRTALDKVADLHARGLFTDFKDDYQNAIHKAIGTSRETLDDLDQVNKIARTAKMLEMSGYGTNNFIGQQLQKEMNEVIAKARFRDSNGFFKFAKGISSLFELVSLSILNNLGNRTQNFFSGISGRNISALQYGYANEEIKNLAFQTKRDIIRGGGVDFGEVANMFNGDRRSTDAVREFLTSWIPNVSGERAANWWFNQLMGVASLNGVDNSVKIKNTWTRFITGIEDILVSKGMERKEAQRKLNEELFGEKWIEARNKAKGIMENIKAKGGVITINEQTVERFAADVVKGQLINNQILKEDELNGAWDAAYRTAGMEMGHVSNNGWTTMLNKLKETQNEKIENALSKGNYTNAGIELIVDMFISKVLFRFAGGGTNWLVLKLEKGGLGIVTGLANRIKYNKDFENKKNLSQMSAAEITESISHIQKANDKIARGTAGLLVNASLLLLAQEALKGDDGEERKKKLLRWMENNRWSNRYINNLVPFYLTAYLAYERQKVKGIDKFANRFSPARSYALNFFNQMEDSKIEQALSSAGNMFSKDENKNEKGLGEFGVLMGQMFNLNPLPYKPVKDAYTLYQGMKGNIKQKWVDPKGIWEGYLKFGILDVPVLETDKK